MQTFSAFYTDELGEAIKDAAINQCPDGFNLSTANPAEYNAIALAWNQGIDSYLEAITNRSTVKFNTNQLGTRTHFSIHPEEVHVLVRRLLELETEGAEDLAHDICTSLNIELV